MKNPKTNLFGIILMIFTIILFLINRPVEAGIVLSVAITCFIAKDSTTTGVGKDSITESEIEKLRQRNQI